MKVNDGIKLGIDRGYITGNSVKFAYVNGINLVHQISLNKTTQSLKKEFGDEYMNYLNNYELDNIKKAEKLIYDFVSTGINLKQIKFIYSKAKKRGLNLI